ncbi:enoyl-CoA hydratase/carnithine racemase [Actinomadura hallensis]|uniref:enoyl-CoA hydratase n=1 Tax=Actinomadura hallensis TaxID=337895 RepID=A0A543ILJ4_9ACTN|nr:enoyl-CoA hydratase-related protein [Actinomadura hallensis]TQM71457.1 enoyl-CoA hydratase/carnithine racemase [Actinomadura hallensis]HLV72436.1 enoyl-CoA hydratase-related protein [Vulgatibacteraceae bacterium]
MDGVTLRRDGHVAEIVLDRPEALNALSTAMARRLADVCAEVAADASARAVVLSAAGEKAFCVGADLKERNAMTDEEIMAQRPVFRAAFGGVLNLPQPVVAAVHGYALGGGCEFALSADLIVADETAVFGLPEVAVGLVPGGGGTQLALRRLGPGKAADLVFTGRRLDAAEARDIGLADRVVPAGAARDEALAIAAAIARNSPVAVRAAKRALRLGNGVPLDAGLDLEENAWRTAVLSPDRREGIAAFNEKRKPVWPS